VAFLKILKQIEQKHGFGYNVLFDTNCDHLNSVGLRLKSAFVSTDFSCADAPNQSKKPHLGIWMFCFARIGRRTETGRASVNQLFESVEERTSDCLENDPATEASNRPKHPEGRPADVAT
jgi:hypothetical protein